jgi:hypothetical protein
MLPGLSKQREWDGAAMRNAYRIFVGKPERKRQRERNRGILEDNIKIGLGEWYWKVWIGLLWLVIGRKT